MNIRKSTDSQVLHKILADIEISRVRDSANPDAVLWSLWACKEAAYKVVKKMDGGAVFTPRRWTVSCSHPLFQKSGEDAAAIASGNDLATAAGMVTVPDAADIPFLLHLESSYVHCIAADSPASLTQALRQVHVLPLLPQEDEHDPSAFARLCLARHLEAALKTPLENIDIRRRKTERELSPPAVYINHHRADIDISLSHDGQYVAHAFVFNPDRRLSVSS